MGKIREIPRAALIAGITYAGQNNCIKAVEMLIEEFGPVEITSPVFEFTMTDYYNAEMGDHLKKQFYCFTNSINLEALPDIKLFTNEIELKLAQGNLDNPLRKVNIDPGYVTLSKLVLASTKDYSHRIFIGKGIFAEITLNFSKETFHPLVSTYPDYKIPLAMEFFTAVREFVKRNKYLWVQKRK